jgi:hypothetical protein
VQSLREMYNHDLNQFKTSLSFAASFPQPSLHRRFVPEPYSLSVTVYTRHDRPELSSERAPQ